eukprot:s3525_g8.t1
MPGRSDQQLFGAPFGDNPSDRNLDWLLDLGQDDDAGPERSTDRLGRDTQGKGSCKTGALPGRGVDHSAWALEVGQPKFFWETDPFLRKMFDQDVLTGPDLKRPAVDIDLAGPAPTDVLSLLKKPKQLKVAGFCEQVIRRVELRDERDKRQSVISNWTSLVCINMEAFTVSDAIFSGSDRVTHAVVETSLTACFARKATSTLTKRFYALNRFVNFCSRHGLQFFPLREHVIFTYLQSMLQDEHTSASAGRSFLESCRFARGILGLRGDMAELGTARVDGVAVELSKRAGPISQASPLLVSGAEEQRSTKQCAAQNLSATGSSSILPWKLGSCDWFRSWLQAREALGLEISGKLSSPLLCRFGADGRPFQQEVTSSECGKLLRKALQIDDGSDSAVRSHSLKATALSWAGKHGVSLETRRLLGHHLDANAKSAKAYNQIAWNRRWIQ